LRVRFVATVDLNRDGRLDLAVVNNPGDTLAVLLGNGDGSFQAPISYDTSPPNSNAPSCIATADLSNDGTPYLVVGGKQHVEIWRSDALGNLQQVGFNFIHEGSFNVIRSIAVGDFDRDGNLDLAVPDNTVVILLGNGDGTFHAGDDISVAPPPGGVGMGPVGIVAADLNVDGLLDLAVAPACCLPVLAILGGIGDGHFQPAVFFTSTAVPGEAAGAACLAVSDFDSDGRPDLAQGSNFYNSFSVLMNTGCGLTIDPLRGTVDMGPGGAGPVDTLLTNGTSNALCYTFNVSAAVGASLRIVEPPSRLGLGARFAMFAWVGWPGLGTDQILPKGIGTIGMRTPIPPVSGVQPFRIANNTGRAILGSENWPGPTTVQAPFTLLNIPPGALTPRIGRRIYFQGIERDDRSSGTASYSVTNGQKWEIVP
jgi:hypothetical protein